MGDTLILPVQPAPLVLEDLVEPLEVALAPEPLPVGTEVVAPDGRSFYVLDVLQAEAQGLLYEAALEEESETVWLWEAATEAQADRLRREAEVLAGLDCPMLPHVLTCFESDGRTYLATEPVGGETLAAALARGELSLPQTLSILAQVAFALTRLHQAGWAHLGLRPSAVALGRPVKLRDLSYATPLGETPPAPFYHAGYSPPELLAEGAVDARADIYAVGALLYHAVSGGPIAETGAETMAFEPPTPVAGVPQILTRCLGSRETRYASMAELHADLRRLARRTAPPAGYAIAAATTIGLEPTRTTNQDAHAFVTGRLESEEGAQAWAAVCVADGMGGMAAGEVASEVAAKAVLAEAAAGFATSRSISAAEQVEMVRQWAQAANDRVCAALEARDARGGTTLVCAGLLQRRLAIAHVGDSRLYLFRDDAAIPLTRDHSLAMALALQGEISLEEVRQHPDRNKVTRSLGDRRPLPDYTIDTLEPATGGSVLELQPGDVLLLCSDGLWEPVPEEAMLAAFHDHAPDLNAASQALLQLALHAGAPDNATAVLIRV